jgi:hypothetical protein
MPSACLWKGMISRFILPVGNTNDWMCNAACVSEHGGRVPSHAAHRLCHTKRVFLIDTGIVANHAPVHNVPELLVHVYGDVIGHPDK